MALVQKRFELDLLDSIKKGIMPVKIAEKLKISMSNLSYHLRKLKDANAIREVGKGVWEVIPSGLVQILSHDGHPYLKETRGHAFIWKIRPNKRFNWISLLHSKQIDYDEMGIRATPRIILNGRKVWLGKNYISIFEPKWVSFFASNPIEAKKEAVYSMLYTLEQLKVLFNIHFEYKFTCKRQHYGFIKNLEAKELLKEGKKILIKDESGYWFSIDNSQNKFEEAETLHEVTADKDGLGYQRLMNSHKKTNFKVTPEFILDSLNSMVQNANLYNKNIATHIEAIQQLGQGVNKLTKVMRGILVENKNLKLQSKHQTQLNQYMKGG